MSSKPSEPGRRRLPEFNPGPSGELVSEIFRDLKISGVLIGRLAVWAWLPDTEDHAFTKDLDMAVSTPSVYSIRRFAADKQIQTADLPIGGINLSHPEKNINVDFIDRSSEDFGDFRTLFEAAIEEAAASERTVVVGQNIIPLVSAEHLIAMKMVAHTKKDEEDIKRLLKTVGVDVQTLREVTARFLGPLGRSYLETLLGSVGHKDARLIKYKKTS